jgi:hypothetical protein
LRTKLKTGKTTETQNATNLCINARENGVINKFQFKQQKSRIMKTTLRIFIVMLTTNLCFSLLGVAQSKTSPLSIMDMLNLSSRQIEQLDTFYVAGKVGSTKNVGFANCYSLCDPTYDKYYVLITSERKTLPNPDEKLTLRVTLYTELRWNKKSLIVLTELK